MIKSELPLEPAQRIQPETRAKPTSDGAGEGDFAHWIQSQDPASLSPHTSQVEGAPVDHQGLATAVVLSATPGVATGVLYGWGLQAQSALSQLVVDALHGVHAASGHGRAPASTAQERALAPLASGVAASRDPGNSGSTQTQMSPLALHRAAPDRTRTTASDSALPRQEAMAAPLLWAERTLRRVPTQDGGATVWLRDYRLGPHEIEQALAELLAQPAETAPVTRVVINGVEVWRHVPPNSQEIA